MVLRHALRADEAAPEILARAADGGASCVDTNNPRLYIDLMHERLSKPCKACGSDMRVIASRFERTLYCSNDCKRAGLSERMAGNKYRVGKGAGPGGFRNGATPWNKGISMALSPETQFKPGQAAHNKDPMGTVRERRTKGGVLRAFVKIAEPNQWEPRAHVVWSEANGPVPTGMLVHHKDRDTLNDSLGNLELVTRAEHLAEHLREYSEARKGRSWSAKRRAKHEATDHSGRPCSPETRAKIGAANKARSAQRKQGAHATPSSPKILV